MSAWKGWTASAAVVVAMSMVPSSSPAKGGGGGGSINKGITGIKVKTRGNKSQLSARAPARPRQGVASPNAVRARSASELVFGAPIRYQNLSIVPVGTTREGPFQKYTLLEEGSMRTRSKSFTSPPPAIVLPG